jgi:excisionase family DNA binding protein
MEKITITQITPEELKALIFNSVVDAMALQQQVIATPPEVFLTVKEAASRLRLSVQAIYGLIHRKKIPYMKREKRCYFTEEDIAAYIKAGRRQSVMELDATNGGVTSP